MRIEKHEEILREVLEEIETALKDSRGLLPHQRRLAFALTLGAVTLLHIHLARLDIIKEGASINHLWFKKRKTKVKEALQNQITSPLDSVPDIEKTIDVIITIEEKRDDLAYGAPSNEKILQDKINLFFELKRLLKC